MDGSDYRNLPVRVAGYRDWLRHPGITGAVNLMSGVVFFLVAYIVVPEQGATVWQRLGTGLLGLVAYGLTVLVLFLIWIFLVVPVRQREVANARVAELEAEIAERDRIEFVLSPSYEAGGAKGYSANGHRFNGVCTLWVEVANNGRVAEFSARIPPTALPVSRLEDGSQPSLIQVYNVAWEQTLNWRQELGVGRLLLANVAAGDSGTIFWFWTAQNATWNKDSHGVGWRLSPLPGVDVIEFPLIVTNITDRKSVTSTCRITFGGNGSFESFGFSGELPQS